MTPQPGSGVGGRVYDRGYRPFEGELGGRRSAVAALWRASMRRALGFRRSWRQKFFPWLLLAIVSVPAIVNVGIAYVTRDNVGDRLEIITYREYVGVSTALLVFVGLTAPDVICPDRRNRTLPLLFARPLTGLDYVLAKVGAIATIVFAFGFIPQAVLFLGQMFVSDAALDYVRDNAEFLWKVPVAVALLSLYYAAIAVAVASFTTRRLVAAATLLVGLLFSSISAGVLTAASATSGQGSPWAALNLLALPLYVRDVVFLGSVDPDSGLGGVAGGGFLAAIVYGFVVSAALLTLWQRYDWLES